MKPHARIQGLDALRGLAIVLVMLRHSWPDIFGGGGIVGVVAFFTLSGYLITGLLASDVRRFGRVRYGRFYRNRAIRLIPPLLWMLLGVAVIEGAFNVGGYRDTIVRSVLVAITYTTDIPGVSPGSPNLSHLWTLANEEQFYIVWPVIIFLGIRFKKLRLVIALAAAGLFLLLVVSVMFSSTRLDRIYTLPSTWTISMIIGAAAQLGQVRITEVLIGWRATIAALVGLAGLISMTFLPDAKQSVVAYLVGGPAIAIFSVLLIFKLREIPKLSAVAQPLVWMGIISYAAYLWNYPIGWWLRDAGMSTGWEWPAIALTIVAAAISWFAIERPLSGLKSWLDARQRASSPTAPARI